MSITQEKKAQICFLTVLLYSFLSAVYIQIESYEVDILLLFVTTPFLIYILFFWIKNPVFRKIFITLEWIYVLSLFFMVLTLSKYDLGEYLLELFLLISNSLIRLFCFLIVSKSKYPVIKALILSLIIGFGLYLYGSTEYLRIM